MKYTNTKQTSRTVKRKAGELDIGKDEDRPKKRKSTLFSPNIAVVYHLSGFLTKAANTYFTNIVRSSATITNNDSVEGFIVKKLTFTVDDSGDGIQWAMSEDSFKVMVEKTAFASGVTKRAYKVLYIQ